MFVTQLCVMSDTGGGVFQVMIAFEHGILLLKILLMGSVSAWSNATVQLKRAQQTYREIIMREEETQGQVSATTPHSSHHVSSFCC